LPSACSFIVDGLAFFFVDVHTTCFGLHGHLQVCMIFYFLFLKESASLFLLPLFLQFLICVCFCCVFVSFLILVCVFGFLPFLVVCLTIFFFNFPLYLQSVPIHSASRTVMQP
jgi:hypothetical protein